MTWMGGVEWEGGPSGSYMYIYTELIHFIVQQKLIQQFQFSPSVVSDSLRPHGLQHARLPCPSLTPRACSNLCPLNGWCHPTISSSVVALSSCPQSFPASGSCQMSQFFASGGQSIGVGAFNWGPASGLRGTQDLIWLSKPSSLWVPKRWEHKEK